MYVMQVRREKYTIEHYGIAGFFETTTTPLPRNENPTLRQSNNIDNRYLSNT